MRFFGHTRFLGSVVPLVAALSAAHAVAPSVLTVNNAGDAGDGTCTVTCTLRDAIANIASGGTVAFDPAILPATITLQKGPLSPSKAMRIEGPGADRLAISAAMSSGVLLVYSGDGPVAIAGLTLRDGAWVGGNGGDGAAGTGQAGGPGDASEGGCVGVYIGKLTLERVSVRNCLAQGGNGGNGGSGTAGTGLSTGGTGGVGGDGGPARGGAIYVDYATELVLIATSIIDAHAVGGNGGQGGDGGNGFFRGVGGAGGNGAGALGGAIYFEGDSLLLKNSTVARGNAFGGNGGKGGMGDSGLATAHGGKGGNGGGGTAGLVYFAYSAFSTSPSATVDFTTAAEGLIAGGSGGAGGGGATPGGSGDPGAEGAFAFVGGAVQATLRSSAVLGFSVGSTTLCKGFVFSAAGAVNAASDDSCDASLHPSLEAALRPLREGAALPVYMPLPASAIVDAATSCNDSSLVPVAIDAQSTSRPQGSACDIGAIEADYVFVDGFN